MTTAAGFPGPLSNLTLLRLYYIAYKANTDGNGGDDGSVAGIAGNNLGQVFWSGGTGGLPGSRTCWMEVRWLEYLKRR